MTIRAVKAGIKERGDVAVGWGVAVNGVRAALMTTFCPGLMVPEAVYDL